MKSNKFLLGIVVLLIAKISFAQIGFGDENIISTNAINNYQSLLYDIDQDGDLDAISVSIDDNKVAWYENDGLGNFGAENIISNSLSGTVQLGDLNGDGWAEIVILGYSGTYECAVYYQNMGGYFSTTASILPVTASSAYFLDIADLDNDGDNDILISSLAAGNVYLLENDGNANFSSQIITSSYISQMEIEAIDVDYDGDLDFIINNQSGSLDWFENIGDLTFEGPINIVPESSEMAITYGFSIEDINLDGYFDIFFCYYTSLRVYYGSENGAFTEEIIFSGTTDLKRIDLCDIDSDNDLDVVMTDRLGDEISYLINEDGYGSFGSQNILLAADNPSWAEAGDINGDLIPDIIFSVENENKIAWLKNTSTPVVTQSPESKEICKNSETFFKVEAEIATDYQWFVSTDGGIYYDIIYDNNIYQGTSTDSLSFFATDQMSDYIYFCEICNGLDFCITTDDAVLTFNRLTDAYAGDDHNICATINEPLYANAPIAGETGYWSSQNTQISFEDVNSPSTIVQNLPLGTTEIYWTLTNGECISKDTVHIINDSIIEAFTPEYGTACEGGEYQLYANIPETGTGRWVFPDEITDIDDITDPFTTISNLPFGMQECTWEIWNGACYSTSNFLLDVITPFDLELTDEIQIAEGENVTIEAPEIPNATYLWETTGDTTQSITVNQEGSYKLIVSIDGCSIVDSVYLKVSADVNQKIIPNTFTPNGDGANDTWKMPANITQNAQITIIDKAGNTITSYSTQELPEGWDGTYKNKTAPSDTYWYIISFDDGTTQTGILVLKR